MTGKFTINQPSRYGEALFLLLTFLFIGAMCIGLFYKKCIEEGQWGSLFLVLILLWVAGYLFLFFCNTLNEDDELSISNYDINLQRTNYKLRIKLKDVEEVLLFKGDKERNSWILVRKRNGRTIPIDLSVFDFSWNSLKQELNSRLNQYNISVYETTLRFDVESILSRGKELPEGRAYTIRNNTKKNFISAIVLTMICISGCIYVFTYLSNTSSKIIISLFLLGFDGTIACLLFKMAARDKIYMTVNSIGVTLDKHKLNWNEISHLEFNHNGRFGNMTMVSKDGERHSIDTYKYSELAEQFTYYSKHFIPIMDANN